MQKTSTTLIEKKEKARATRGTSLLRNPAGMTGLFIVIVLVVVAVAAPWIAPYGIREGDLLEAKKPPIWQEGGSPQHVLGTDQLGQDILSRIIYGARVSLTVGFFGVLLAVIIGVTLGIVAGYTGGWLDAIISGITNLLLSIPYLIIVIVAATIFGRSLLNVILLFGITNAPVFIRLARGEVLKLKQQSYIESARGLGASPGRIILRHLFPNMLGPLLTIATFEMSAMIFYESGLSFLGLSVPPEVPSWGNMLALGRKFLTIFPWMALYPGLAIAVTALGVNLLGEWLRDALDPKRGNLGR
jgi:ABC-type dipeptide/oligopeptide/nickel transport system permease subunit